MRWDEMRSKWEMRRDEIGMWWDKMRWDDNERRDEMRMKDEDWYELWKRNERWDGDEIRWRWYANPPTCFVNSM